MLVKDDRVLVEQRRSDKLVDPGAIAVPGGHIEGSESPDDAVVRELHEELALQPTSIDYVCTLVHRSQEVRRIHYFRIDHWTGEMASHEAEALLWIRLDEPERLDLTIDRVAVAECLRLYGSGGRAQ